MKQEEKAKRYDELLLKLQKAKVDDNVCDEMYYRVIDDIVPELKENEDEVMRSMAIKAVHAPEAQSCIKSWGINPGDVIAWLEKHGKQKQDPCEHCADKRLNCHNFPCVKGRAFKQGKSVLEAIIDEKVDNANKVEPKDYSSIAPHFGKPIDKVEPKFKQGQWIIWKDKCYKVNYNGCGYELIDQNGLSTSLEYGTVDTSARLWDVTKDAKDGDVLCTYECDEPKIVFILKGTPKKHYALSYHCYYNIMYPHFEPDSKKGCLAPNDEDVKPATKEQREQLKKAMADAGYTFDFDKKELKKIVAPKFKIGDTMRTLQEASNGITSGLPVVVSIDNEYYHCNNELIAIKDQDNYEYPPMNRRQNPAWSEEDKIRITHLISLVEHHHNKDYDYFDYSDLAKWLKSLRPQNTWKPSDEQIKAVRLARNFVTDDFGENHTLSDVLVELEKQLKKLK